MILSIDPGETSGFCILEETKKINYNKKDAKIFKKVGEKNLHFGFDKIIESGDIHLIVYEEFKLYPWKAKAKSWSTFPTVEVIGILKYLAAQNDIPIIGQGADCKQFFDDKKLKWCKMYKGYSPHERDAIRHALYYLDFKEDN